MNDNKQFSEILKRRIYSWILQLIKFIDKLSYKDPLGKVVRDQLMRSGTSVGANYVEAIGCGSKAGFAQFLEYALKSGNESKFWLALVRDSDKGDKDIINKLLKELTELTNILGSSISTMRKK